MRAPPAAGFLLALSALTLARCGTDGIPVFLSGRPEAFETRSRPPHGQHRHWSATMVRHHVRENGSPTPDDIAIARARCDAGRTGACPELRKILLGGN